MLLTNVDWISTWIFIPPCCLKSVLYIRVCTYCTYVHMFWDLYSSHMCALYVQYTCPVMSSRKFKACFMCECLFIVNAMPCIAARSGCDERVCVGWYFL